MSRKQTRENALKLLYAGEINKVESFFDLERLFLKDNPLSPVEEDYWKEILSGVREQKDKLNEVIAKYLCGWKIDRIPTLDKIILQVAIFELLYLDYIPPNASIAEAVRLSRIYGEEDSRSYINALLGNLDRKVKEAGLDWKKSKPQEILDLLIGD